MLEKNVILCVLVTVFLIGFSAHAQETDPSFSTPSEKSAGAFQTSEGPAEAGDLEGPARTSDSESTELSLQTSWPNVLGHWLFWPGVVTSLTGIILIEVGPHGKIGVAGAITAGIGVATIASGAFVLGLAYLLPRVYNLSGGSSVAVAPLREGIALGYSRAF